MKINHSKLNKHFFKAFLFFAVFSLIFSSCSLFHGGRKSDTQMQKEAVKKQNKAIDEEVKAYEKLYKEQTDRQTKDQRKKIKKSRKKPQHMKTHKQKKQKQNKNKKMGRKANERTFFLWRWLGI